MQIKRLITSPIFLGAIAILSILVSTVLVVRSQASSGGAQACYDQSKGDLRLLVNGSSCEKQESPVTLQTGSDGSGIHSVKFEGNITKDQPLNFTLPAADTPLMIMVSITDVTAQTADGRTIPIDSYMMTIGAQFDSKSQKFINWDYFSENPAEEYLYNWGVDIIAAQINKLDWQVVIERKEFNPPPPPYPVPDPTAGDQITSAHILVTVWY